jgi:hypothetical protein
MSISEYVVRRQNGVWEVWLADRLLSGHPTQKHAVAVANIARSQRGRSRRHDGGPGPWR